MLCVGDQQGALKRVTIRASHRNVEEAMMQNRIRVILPCHFYCPIPPLECRLVTYRQRCSPDSLVGRVPRPSLSLPLENVPSQPGVTQ